MPKRRPSNPEGGHDGPPLPEAVRGAGVTRARDFDVRPILAKGGDPFLQILKAAEALTPGEALHLIVGFESTPLYTVMRSMGHASHTELAGDVFHIWFYRDEHTRAETPLPKLDERAALQPPIQLDVRGLEPPQPVIAILEKLVELGPGAQLLVHHHGEPVLLYEKLVLRGYGARTEKRDEGDYLIHVAPAWVFDTPS